ncbi:SUPPRESSOR OF ABI3-5 [Bienertia sinuspersici]
MIQPRYSIGIPAKICTQLIAALECVCASITGKFCKHPPPETSERSCQEPCSVNYSKSQEMDGRYGVQHGWENNSALEAYGAVHEPNYRVGSGYDDRRFLDERFPRDSAYSRGSFHRDVERENYAVPPPVGLWPQARRRGYEDEFPLEREPRRHDKSYLDPYHEMDDFCDGHRAGRFGMRDRDDYAFDDYDYRRRRGDSRERDYDYGRHSHDSDYDRSRRDGSWRRRDSRDRERDRRDSSHERDLSPYRRHSRSRSRSHGRDDCSKSRSPRGRSRGRSHLDDSYDDRYDRIERRREREEKRHDQYSTIPSATVVVKGLSQKTSEEDLYQILAEWGPLRHVRVIKERNSGVSRGFAFIDFPSVVEAHSIDAAQAMMDKIGLEGLVVDGRKLLFEYSSKPTGGSGGVPYGQDGIRSSNSNHRNTIIPTDWMCTICGCVNFARRVSCFQEVQPDQQNQAS